MAFIGRPFMWVAFVANGLINKGITPEKCFVVPYTVDLTRFTPSDTHPKSKHRQFENLVRW